MADKWGLLTILTKWDDPPSTQFKNMCKSQFWHVPELGDSDKYLRPNCELGILVDMFPPANQQITTSPSWWLNNPFEKYAQVKLDHLPRCQDKNEKMFQTTTQLRSIQSVSIISCLVFLGFLNLAIWKLSSVVWKLWSSPKDMFGFA